MNYNIPPEYKPIKPFGYLGYNLLYAIPLIGFIALLVNAIGAKNLNVRNYARSFLWNIFFIITLVVVIVALFYMGYMNFDIKFFDYLNF